MENGYSIMDLLLILKRRWLLVSITIVLGLGVGAAVTFYVMTPQYKMSSQFIVNQSQPLSAENSAVTVENIRSNIELINTYNVIIKSPAVLDEVKTTLGLQMSTQELKEKISVSNAEESQVVDVTVTDSDPEKAAEIADTTVLTFKESIPDLMKVDNVQVLSQADVTNTTSPFSPNIVMNLLVSLAAGLAIGGGLAFFLETYDTTIRKEKDVIDNLDMPFMGTVSNVGRKHGKRYKYSQPTTKTVEMRGESIGS